MEVKKSNKGGARPGAGAKPKGKVNRSEVLSVRVTPEHMTKLLKIDTNKADAVIKCIEAFDLRCKTKR